MTQRWLAPLVLVLVLLGVWQLYCAVSGIDPLVLPPPTAVGRALFDDRSLLWSNFAVTAEEVLLGMLAALVAGVLLAAAIHCSATLRRAFYPVLIASQTVPISIVAPILLVWLGFGLAPKLLIVMLVCFFAITVATLDGLAAVDPQLHKLMSSLGATRWQTLRRVEAPSALPGLFSGLRIAVAASLVGAVFAEWSGANTGLGHVILQARGQLLTARACGGGPARSVRDRDVRLAGDAGTAAGPVGPAMRRGLAALALAVVLGGCGERQEATTPATLRAVTVAVPGGPSTLYTPLYSALAEGDFQRAGLAVTHCRRPAGEGIRDRRAAGA